jgi:hypothetical protein
MYIILWNDLYATTMKYSNKKRDFIIKSKIINRRQKLNLEPPPIIFHLMSFKIYKSQ